MKGTVMAGTGVKRYVGRICFVLLLGVSPNVTAEQSTGSQAPAGDDSERRVLPEDGFVSEADILIAVRYPGNGAERNMLDLLKADYHVGKAKYFLNRKKAGFMAHERFDLAYERAIGDIRLLASLGADQERLEKALNVFRNWQAAFRRAQIRDKPRRA